MTRLFMILTIMSMSLTHFCLAQEHEYKAEHFHQYMFQQKLPYDPAKGCQTHQDCELIKDFNGDGKQDFAGLFEYMGGQHRRKNWYIDLIIVYTQNDKLNHVIFNRVGRVSDDDKTVSVALELQKPGIMQIIPDNKAFGTHTFDKPAIHVIDKRRGKAAYFPTIYWQKNKFVSLNKWDD